MKKFVFVPVLVVFFSLNLSAQTDSVAGKNYSFLNFESLDSFYVSKNLPLNCAKYPDLFFEIFDWLNVPYATGKRAKTGIDCSSFASVLYDAVFHLAFRGDCKTIYKMCETFPAYQLREGDLVFFQISGPGPVSHVGVYIGNNKFAHASVRAGVIVSDMNEAYYKRYFVSGGRLKLF